MRLYSSTPALLLLCVAITLPWTASSPLAQPASGSPSADGQGACRAPQLGFIAAGSCPAAPLQQEQQQQQLESEALGSGSAATCIVRFKEYRMASEHRQRLQRALAGSRLTWRWVSRHNPASAYPTDFGLLQLEEPFAAAKESLLRLSFVRGVHPDRRLSRALMEAGPEGSEQQLETANGGRQVGAPSHSTSTSGSGGSDGSGGSGSGSSSSSNNLGDGEILAQKRPGRLQTRPTFSLEDNLGLEAEGWAEGLELSERVGNDSATAAAAAAAAARRRRLLLSGGQELPLLLGADKLWEEGFRGQAVKMGVFDTGIRGDHPHVKNVRERTNWTHEPTLDDGLGHGSFVAGVIASTDVTCPGLAPEVELYTFRVFTNDQVSYTSWFLDAFNYAIATKMDVVNLSIGGPDYLDEPFVEKVLEITSNGILMVSAIGNDGPLYGTLNNPADQSDVIGVGGIDFSDRIASFSSRGMSTWELPLGYGRSKPDVMAYGRDVQGSRINGGCRSLSGTSVASPVVAGAVCLLASVVPQERRRDLLNPASMKQALVEGATRLPHLNMYEQGQGKINVLASKDILASYVPRASVVPSRLDLTDCPFMWPFCKQPLYAGAMPTMFNATVLNGMGLTGTFAAAPVFTPTSAGGQLLELDFEYSDMLWPWSGYLAIYIRVKQEGAAFNGTATGDITFTINSPTGLGENLPRSSKVTLPLTASIIPTPPRQKRVLWDQFHSIRYPPAYFPRDDLQVRHDILDWHGDHPHTNYHDMYDSLRSQGYYLEVLASPYTCFNASQYGALLVVDPEDEFYTEEVTKLEHDVRHLGLGLLVFGDWYDEETLGKLRFYDDNTRSWWEAATGGANVPALNDLLAPYGVAFGRGVLDGSVSVPGAEGFKMASGTRIAAFPAGGHLHRSMLASKQGSVRGQSAEEAVLGLLNHGAGRLAMYGDSNCLDSSHQRSNCFEMLRSLLEFATEGADQLLAAEVRLTEPYGSFDKLPTRRSDYNFSEVSPVLSTPLRCYPNSPKDFQGQDFSQWHFNITRPAATTAAATVASTATQPDPVGAGTAGQAATQAAGGGSEQPVPGTGEQAAGAAAAQSGQQAAAGGAAALVAGAAQQAAGAAGADGAPAAAGSGATNGSIPLPAKTPPAVLSDTGKAATQAQQAQQAGAAAAGSTAAAAGGSLGGSTTPGAGAGAGPAAGAAGSGGVVQQQPGRELVPVVVSEGAGKEAAGSKTQPQLHRGATEGKVASATQQLEGTQPGQDARGPSIISVAQQPKPLVNPNEGPSSQGSGATGSQAGSQGAAGIAGRAGEAAGLASTNGGGSTGTSSSSSTREGRGSNGSSIAGAGGAGAGGRGVPLVHGQEGVEQSPKAAAPGSLVMSMSQVFAVLGALGVALLWSTRSRRRTAVALLGSPTSRRSWLGPIFGNGREAGRDV